MSNSFGNSVEKYDIETELGQDDLTIIYSARRKSDDTPVVVRVVAPQFVFDTFFIRRFRDTVARSMQLEHPNIVKVFEVGEKDDIVYIVREWVRGESLATYLQNNGPLSLAKVIPLIRQLVSALDYAHAQGVKHGDLSDTSIFIRDEHIWVTDFGILMAMDGTSLVKKGFATGHPAYLSPERVQGEGSSRLADLYALGAITYQMLIGHPPFWGDAPSVMHAQVYNPPPPLHELNPKITQSVSEVILRMLSKGLEFRYRTGEEFVAALQAAARDTLSMRRLAPPLAHNNQATTTSASPISLRFLLWSLILTPLIGLALAGGFWGTTQWLNEERRNRLPSNPPAAEIALQPVIVSTLPTQTTLSQPTLSSDLNDQAPSIFPITPLLQDNSNPVIAGTATPLPLLTITPPPTSTPNNAESPLPTTPNQPTVADSSPFTNLILARGINDAYQPIGQTNIFPPTREPVYLFFDYDTIQAGTAWRQIWRWDDIVLRQNEGIWPQEYGSFGTAWVFFSPSSGFNPGPYSIDLEVEGQIVASATFIVQGESQ